MALFSNGSSRISGGIWCPTTVEPPFFPGVLEDLPTNLFFGFDASFGFDVDGAKSDMVVWVQTVIGKLILRQVTY